MKMNQAIEALKVNGYTDIAQLCSMYIDCANSSTFFKKESERMFDELLKEELESEKFADAASFDFQFVNFVARNIKKLGLNDGTYYVTEEDFV